jgi:hypothetical protein
MTDKEMHYSFAKIFNSLRDPHTAYAMPAPHSCYTFVTAASFTFVQNKNMERTDQPQVKVVVRGLSIDAKVLALSPDSSKMAIGDELLTIDGMALEDYFTNNMFLFGGANEWGGKRQILSTLSARDGNINPVPEADTITYELKSFGNGNSYSVTLPWVAKSTDECQEEYQKFLQGLETSSFVSSESNPKNIKSDILKLIDDAGNNHLRGFKDAFGMGGDIFNPTSDPKVSWAIWKPETKNLGVIKLTSFELESDVKVTLKLIRDLLTNQLKDTNALVWDVRSNEGGSIRLADSLPQFFGFEMVDGFEQAIVPGFKRAVVSPANEFVFLNIYPPSHPWHQAYLNSKPGDTYIPLTRIISVEDANIWGAVYLKPVGVFHDGSCYSACDMFAASMKDNSGATIFGEDGTSGAGGYYNFI